MNFSTPRSTALQNALPNATLPVATKNPGQFARWFLMVMVASAFALNTSAQATTSIFESYAILSLSGGANAFYDLNAVTANPDFQGANLGSFNASNSLVVKGGQNKTVKCNGGNVTNGHTYWRVWKTSAGPSGTFTSITQNYVSDDGGVEKFI